MAKKTIDLEYDLPNEAMTARVVGAAGGGAAAGATAAAAWPAAGTAGAAAKPATDPSAKKMSTIQVKQGDTLDWASASPGVSDWVIHLEPASAFEPNIYWPATADRAGSGSVQVVGDPSGGKATCGFVYNGKLWGYPLNKTYGHDIDP